MSPAASAAGTSTDLGASGFKGYRQRRLPASSPETCCLKACGYRSAAVSVLLPPPLTLPLPSMGTAGEMAEGRPHPLP